MTGASSGKIIYKKDSGLRNGVRDVDLSGEGRILFSDILLITSRYKNVSTDSTYALTYDIDNDGELDVSDLSRIGLQYNAR